MEPHAGNRQLTLIPILPSISLMSETELRLLSASALVPMRLTVSVLSHFSEKVSARTMPESMTPCMKSPLRFPSTSINAILDFGYLFLASMTAPFTSSPIIPEGHDVMTAMSSSPLDNADSSSSLRQSVPPNIMSLSFMSVQLTQGSEYALIGMWYLLYLPYVDETHWNAKWAQLRGACSMVVRPSIDEHVLLAPENAHPP